MTVGELKNLLEMIPDHVDVMVRGLPDGRDDISDVIAICGNSKIGPGWRPTNSSFTGKVYIRSKSEASVYDGF